MRATLLLALLPSLGGCFAVVDLDRFEVDEGGEQLACDLPAPVEPAACEAGDATVMRDLRVDLGGFGACTGQRLELRIVDRTFVVVGRAVIEKNAASARFVMPGGLPAGTHTMDLLVDLDGNLDDDLAEPSWREPICDDGRFIFEADSAVQSIADPDTRDIGNDFVLRMRDMAVHTSGTQALTVAVVERGSGQMVGYYRRPDVTESDFDVVIPGIIVNGLAYRIDFYVDANQNGVFDSPPTDHGWREMQGGTTTGLELTFFHNTDFTAVGESFPEP